MAVSTLGISGTSSVFAAAYDRPITWISPRGSLENVGDYPYWIALKMGYFDGMETKMEPGPSDGTATVKFVDVGQADMGFPSPGVFTFGLEAGMKLTSAFHIAPKDTFSFAFRKGEGMSDLKGLEGKTILLGSAAWQSIVDPMLAAQGVDITKITYLEAGWPAWGAALAAGQGTAALAWEGLRAEWTASGLDFDYWLGIQKSALPANTFVVRSADLEDPDKVAALKKYLRGWSKGLEFAQNNPRAAVQIVFDQFPALASGTGPELGTVSVLQQMNVYRGDMESRQGWGWHDMASWQLFFDLAHKLGQTKELVVNTDVCTNMLIESANDFDASAVKADADAFELSADFAAVDVNAMVAKLYEQAV